MPAVTIVKWGGITVIASLLLVSAIFAMQFEQVRFGGELHRKNQQVSDLVADILPPPEYVIEAYLETTKLLQDPATLPERRARLSKLRDEYLAREKYWRQSDLDPALKRQLLDASAKEAQAFWRDVDGDFLPAIASGDMAAAQQAYARVDADYRNHRTHIDKLVTMAAAQQTAVREATMSKIGAVKILLAAFAAILIAMVGAAIWFSMSRIAHPLRRITAALGRLADGDMEVTVDTPQKKDEIGDLSRALIALRDQLKASYAQIGQQTDMIVSTVGEALSQLATGNLGYRLTATLTGPFAPLKDNYNDAAQSLEQAMTEVGHASSGVDAAAAEIRSAADDLAKRTELQASTVTETAAAVEHLAGSVGRTAQCSDDAQRLVIEARENAANSKLVAQDAVSAMTDIERSSAEISQIVELINGIAFQTNLLALNAGVEAARAGDAGKGFAVVASEVRVLALRTAEAASDIKARVANSGRLVTNGVRMVAESGAAIDDIIERITKVSDIVVSIAGDAITQADTLRQVNLAVQDMDRSTHQNAAMAEQTTAAVQNLAMQARDLKQQVNQFLSESDAGYRTADGTTLAA